MAITASTVSPFPNPSAEYIAGANRGNPQPANERRQDTAAIAVPIQIKGKRIDDIRLNTLKVDNDTRTDEHDALFSFRVKLHPTMTNPIGNNNVPINMAAVTKCMSIG
jgi:hypothetical protein